jgi:trehalose-6-phosphate synthase
LLALAALTCKTQKVTFTWQVANFISGAEVEGGNIHYNGRTIHFDKYVVGIDCQRFADTIEEPEVQTRIQELEAQYKDKTIIIGVDRMDYTKGLPEKMEGFRVFLDEHPELSEKVVLIQIAIPSREDVKKYQDLEAEVSKLVGQITGKYGKWLRKSIRLHTPQVLGLVSGKSMDLMLTVISYTAIDTIALHPPFSLLCGAYSSVLSV